jgi:hypothetical protein
MADETLRSVLSFIAGKVVHDTGELSPSGGVS